MNQNRMFYWFHYLLFGLCLSFSLPALSQTETNLVKANQYLVKLSQLTAQGKKITQTELDKAIAIAKTRQAALVKAIQKDPAILQQFALSQDITHNLPKQLEPFMEKRVNNLEGTIEIRAALYLKGKEKQFEVMQYALTLPNGTIVSLHFTDKPPVELKSGDRLLVRQAMQLSGNDYVVSPQDVTVTSAAAMTQIPRSFGPQPTIVFLVNFRNDTSRPWTAAQITPVFFDQVNSMYNEFSYRQTTVIGNVIGWFTLEMDKSGDCGAFVNAIPGLAENAARRAGIDVSQYIHRVYAFPFYQGCPWVGLAGFLGQNPYSNAWLNGSVDASLVGHEMGHNLGLNHSRALRCPGTSNTGNCTNEEYGDFADVMGIEGTSHFNAFQKERLGWLSYAASPPLRTVTTTGTYTVDPYETTNQNVKALKILKRTRSDGSKDYYYVEFRQGIGWDANLGSCRDCDFTRGVLVHQGNNVNSDSSDLLDMSPTDNNTRLMALLPGRSFSDSSAPNGGVTITTNSVSSTGASVRVTFGGGGVDPTPPPPPSNTTFAYNVRLGYPFNRVTINQNMTCPSVGNNPVCLVSSQPVGSNLVISGSNGHVCTLRVQSNGGLTSVTPSNTCYVNIAAATSTQPGSVSLPSGF